MVGLRSHPFAASDKMRTALDKLAADRGVSRSRLIREALYAAFPAELEELREQEEDEGAVAVGVGSLLVATALLLAVLLGVALLVH